MTLREGIQPLLGKIKLEATLRLLTGMHIGASKDFAPIGAVDSVFIRDPLTMRPIIPGSSLKGKLRTLLARTKAPGPMLKKPDDDPDLIKRLFGASKPVMFSRLQFYDSFMTEASVQRIERMNTDLYLSEIKFENTINRLTAVANPRQIERVPAGAEFALQFVYNLEDAAEAEEDLTALATALQLLALDYLGGHGSRGYGRIAYQNFAVSLYSFSGQTLPIDEQRILSILQGAGLHAV